MGFKLRLPSRTQISHWIIYSLFAGLFTVLPTALPPLIAPAKAAPAITDSNGCPVGWTYEAAESRCYKTWNYSGRVETFTPPVGITYLDIVLLGAKGGKGGNDASRVGAASSPSGFVRGTLKVSNTPTFTIAVGDSGTVGPTQVGGYGYWRATPAGTNPLGGYAGGAGGSSSIYGTSGAGGGGGAATVLQVSGNTIVAAGAGGGGGAGLNNGAAEQLMSR